MVAALSLNIFHKYTERLKMANIAQIANVLQSMVLTRGDKMVLTPTYHVFRMYNVHQDAIYLPTECNSEKFTDGNGRECPYIDVTASKDASGRIHLTLVNTCLDENAEVSVPLESRNITGEILTADKIQDHNTFDSPDRVRPVEFKDFRTKGGKLMISMPSKSIVSLTIF
jgi:alpha-N-arabinofuranosidase